MKRGWRSFAFIATGFIFSIAVGYLVNMATASRYWLWIASLFGSVIAAIGSVLAAFSTDRTMRMTELIKSLRDSGSTVPASKEFASLSLREADPASTLVIGIGVIEAAANQALESMPHHSAGSLFQLREELKIVGLWTQDDVKSFDQAMAVRNRIVHGDKWSQAEIRVALSDVDRLLTKLTEPSGERIEASGPPPEVEV